MDPVFAGHGAPFINIIRVLWGLTIAFLANDTWSAHDRAIKAVYKEVNSLNLQALLLRKASEIRDERDQRVTLNQTHVNPLKWLEMGFLGLQTLVSIAVVHVDRPRAALVATVLFALAEAPTAAIVLIQGNPFQHPTDVTPVPIAAAVSSMHPK